MPQGPLRLAILAAVLAFGATGVAVALTGLGVPFLLGAVGAAIAAGLVLYAAMAQLARAAPRQTPAEAALLQQIEEYRAATAVLRHDLRGVLSPALMMSDRLVNHADPAVQRAGQAVVRSVERATTLLASNRVLFAADPEKPAR